MFEPLLFIRDPEDVMSPGFIQHDLSKVDAVIVVRPGVDAAALLKAAAAFFATPDMQAVVAHLAPKVKH